MKISILLTSLLLFAGCGSAGDDDTSTPADTRITEADTLYSDIDNLCTYYVGNLCYLVGAESTTYSNGLIEFRGQFFYYVEYANGDSDSYMSSSMGGIVKQTSIGHLVLLDTIARPGSPEYRSLWLVYTTATKKFQLVYDTDNDGVYEAADEVIETLGRRALYVE